MVMMMVVLMAMVKVRKGHMGEAIVSITTSRFTAHVPMASIVADVYAAFNFTLNVRILSSI